MAAGQPERRGTLLDYAAAIETVLRAPDDPHFNEMQGAAGAADD